MPTYSVLDILSEMGFFPMMAAQSRCRIPGKTSKKIHIITFMNHDHLYLPRPDVPELVLVNRHDRSSAYKFYNWRPHLGAVGVWRNAALVGRVLPIMDEESCELKPSLEEFGI